jgi:glutamate-1-semialdehyde 2,1-aminomutase
MLSAQTVENRLERLQSLRNHIFTDYRQKTPGSAAMFERARKVLPGGVSGNNRYFDPYPLYINDASGCEAGDVDGNRYIDCFSANGPMLLGHNHPAIVEAVEAVKDAGSLPLNPPLMIDCAELITRMVPCAERVRFLNTGTEAVMSAVRIARAYTGKNKILKFHGHYHGQHDQFLFGLGSSRDTFSAGVPASAISSICTCVYKDVNELAKMLVKDQDIAAVILDPAMHAGGLWGSNKDDLQEIRRLTERHGVLLIFDEVITGCRLAPGGAQEYFGVTPDLVTMAKALAAGEKLALVAGREEVMEVVSPEASSETPRVFQSGTVNDGAVALAATRAALNLYTELADQGQYQRLAKRALRLKNGIVTAFEHRGMGCQVNHLASMLQIFFTRETVDFNSAQALDMSAVQLFYNALINEGIMLSLPTQNHIYLSFAHTDEDIDKILKKVETVLDRYDFASVINPY